MEIHIDVLWQRVGLAADAVGGKLHKVPLFLGVLLSCYAHMNDRHILILLISIGIPLLRACRPKKESGLAESGEAAFAFSVPPVSQAAPYAKPLVVSRLYSVLFSIRIIRPSAKMDAAIAASIISIAVIFLQEDTAQASCAAAVPFRPAASNALMAMSPFLW